MKEASFCNIQEVLRRTVKRDGRIGGFHSHIGETVDVIIYQNSETEEHEDN